MSTELKSEMYLVTNKNLKCNDWMKRALVAPTLSRRNAGFTRSRKEITFRTTVTCDYDLAFHSAHLVCDTGVILGKIMPDCSPKNLKNSPACEFWRRDQLLWYQARS